MARLAAVQALYQMEFSGASADEALRYQAARPADAEDNGEPSAEADEAFLADLVRGVGERREDVDRLLEQKLAEGWPLERLEAVLRAILRTGAYELLAHPEIDAPVTIDEYVEIAKAFFGGREPSMVNGVLDGLAKMLREGAVLDAQDGPQDQ